MSNSGSGEKPVAPVARQPPSFLTDKNNPIGWAYTGTKEFANDSVRLVRRCTKPDAKEFKKIAVACSIGFAIMGFIGYAVKLVFIPINAILVGGQ
uniref:Protein translocase SEC61 complex gamma subunit, archaeal and eukaryotic n=1 Tax=Chromera velia CCMP2878 TaxID=1169474 RepID=A0A0G4IF38_9ALVE|mmetsp:Transcript_33809/g.66951  ORF Transcript_33809/g.66951 Transcript_33809/m.66951 type:complete len:95 (+) Transcript_33809:140-424(+)|eukprot:Cvel_13796.t1-p1 / transcript=Cvel_13796.t1 / gene=Cvel_13796 / organism=Chromera_velia_CCMP2878 / gene_product=Protein transport protein Sec61 subunit gamma, putative / transcript_product=Protein transport protein Sec61 subunit gamma, putative / location=Cvel_scaffold957:2695-3067(+) / protein_length=94 / sequence_SO=supercontig / SO=protein_coding / is_pseudo=false